jgi:hypothetical protein
MNASESAEIARNFGSAVRPGLILSVALVGGVFVGEKFDRPVYGLAGGFAVAAIVNGLFAWNDARSAV